MKDNYIKKLQNQTLLEQLSFLASTFKGRITFSTSFGLEDQVISDIIFTNNLDIRIFTLDTGRLFEEAYQVMEQTREKYGKPIHVYFPDKEHLENLLTEKGPFSFYQSVENRKKCCHIRKVEPLTRALQGMDCWITGLRSEQSEARKNLPLMSWDETFQIYKYNPLEDWNLSKVVSWLKSNAVPYNSLHDNGFMSIGCAPCTRAVKPGENIRNGRWWWEVNTKKECGLHQSIPAADESAANLSELVTDADKGSESSLINPGNNSLNHNF